MKCFRPDSIRRQRRIRSFSVSFICRQIMRQRKKITPSGEGGNECPNRHWGKIRLWSPPVSGMVLLPRQHRGDAVGGKGLPAAGGYLNDAFLMEAAASQTDWLFGKNPFGRSLMYGVGTGYQQLFLHISGYLCGTAARGNRDGRQFRCPLLARRQPVYLQRSLGHVSCQIVCNNCGNI